MELIKLLLGAIVELIYKPVIGAIVELIKLLLGPDRLVKMFHICQVRLLFEYFFL